MMRAMSSWLAIKRSNHLRKMMLRSLAVLAFHAGQAALAAAIAAAASAGPRLATSASLIPVAGSKTSKRVVPLTHCPLMSASVLSRVGSLSWESGEAVIGISQWLLSKIEYKATMLRSLAAKAKPGLGPLRYHRTHCAVLREGERLFIWRM